MNIAFYAPFKPLDHPNPSGDQMIGRGLYESLEAQGHTLQIISSLRCRWIYWHPDRLLAAQKEIQQIKQTLTENPVDCWLTYHCYYKSPDILGPEITRQLSTPYVIWQGSYATKFRRCLKTRAGFLLNKKALLHADLHISDRRHDILNLQRIIPSSKLHIVKPGIIPNQFSFDKKSRKQLRQQWQTSCPVIFTAAMMREDVKSEGIKRVIESCAELHTQKSPFKLVIAGDGPARTKLENLAQHLLPGKVIFLGKIAREKMYKYYSAADFFVFPGFRESLGMVFLEAQSCGLPVIACDNGGIPEVVIHGKSGFLSPLHDKKTFVKNIKTLLTDVTLRQQMSQFAANYISVTHNRETNYQNIGSLLSNVVQKYTAEKKDDQYN